MKIHTTKKFALGAPTTTTYNELVRKTSELSDIPITALLDKGRGTQQVATWRMAMFHSLRSMGATFNQIGTYFGRNHSTVMHGCRVIEDQIELQDPFVLHILNQLNNNGDTNN